MQVLTIILSILVPVFAAFGWMINKLMEMKKDINVELMEMKKDINVNLRNLDKSMSRIEGYIEGKTQWESKDKKLGEE